MHEDKYITKKQEKEVSGSVLAPLGKKMRKGAEEHLLLVEGFCKAFGDLIGKQWMDRAKFIADLKIASKRYTGGVPGKAILKTILKTVGERDEEAEICLDDDGKQEADNELKDYERVPWGIDINEYFKKEVLPYASDAWIDESVKDEKDKT